MIALTNTEAAEARAHWQTVGVPLAEHAIYTAPNGVHAEDFAALPAGEPFRTRWKLGDGPVVIFLGRLHARKGLHLLIPAFAEAVRQTPDARLLIAGPDEGMLARLQSLVSDHDLTGRVIFTGMISGQDKLAALAAADVFALPAVGEGFSMAVLEAMACALPVLLTPGCNFPEAAGEGAGLVVQREIAPLAKGLRHLLTDDERRASMGRRARELVHERYTWPQVVVQLEAIYQDAVRRRHEHA